MYWLTVALQRRDASHFFLLVAEQDGASTFSGVLLSWSCILGDGAM